MDLLYVTTIQYNNYLKDVIEPIFTKPKIEDNNNNKKPQYIKLNVEDADETIFIQTVK